MSNITEEERSTKIDRIHTFDLLRGMAIIGILFIHRILYDYLFSFYTGGGLPPEIAMMFLFITMAGIFYVISGAVNAFMIYKRLTTNRITPKNVISSGWITGVLMIGFSLFYRIFLLRTLDDSMPIVLMEDYLINRTGILPYLLLFWRLPDPLIPVAAFIGMETLSMIGVINIVISTFMVLLFKMKGFRNSMTVYGALALMGLAIFIISPFLRFSFGEISQNEYSRGNLLLAFFTEPLMNGMMPIFPHLSYGCFGALVGIAIGREEKPKKMLCGLKSRVQRPISTSPLHPPHPLTC